MEIKEFSKLCETAKTIENAFNSTVLDQVNTVSADYSTEKKMIFVQICQN